MIIHTLMRAERIDDVAKKYGIPKQAIEVLNDIDADGAACGQQLLILTPLRTHKMKHGESLAEVAKRYGVGLNTLVASNFLTQNDTDLCDRLITTRYDTHPRGTLAYNGYYYGGVSKDRLMWAMPHLNFITVSCAVAHGNDIKHLFDDCDVVRCAKENGKIALLRIYDESCGRDYENGRGEFIRKTVALAKERGYDGITLAQYRGMREAPSAYRAFTVEAQREILAQDMMLLCEVDMNSPKGCAELCEMGVVMYEKCMMDCPSSFARGEEKILRSYATAQVGGCMFVDIPSFAYADREPITIQDALRIARTAGCEITHDKQSLISCFEYEERGFLRRVKFESLENLKTKLHLIAELGFMGVSFDIGRIPTSHLALMRALYTPEVSYVSAGGM